MANQDHRVEWGAHDAAVSAATQPFTSLLGATACTEAIGHLACIARATPTETTIVNALHDAFRSYSVWSAEHSIRVGLLVAGLADSLGYSAHDAARMGFSSCLHDIGKLRIPKNLIDKPGQFDPAEREIMQAHVLEGLNVVTELREASRDFAPAAILYHHECFDGSGYPNGLHGEDLPEIARMARICDVYDAVRFDRPYRPGLGRDGALALLDRAANEFQPSVLASFKANIAGIESVISMRARA